MWVCWYAWVSIAECSICAGMYGYVWVCVGMCGYVWLCVGMCGYVWVCVGMCGYVWVCVGMCGYVGMCGVSMWFWGCRCAKVGTPSNNHWLSFGLRLSRPETGSPHFRRVPPKEFCRLRLPKINIPILAVGVRLKMVCLPCFAMWLKERCGLV